MYIVSLRDWNDVRTLHLTKLLFIIILTLQSVKTVITRKLLNMFGCVNCV